jgi:thiol-disulfide isomerase/thioredoxin
MEHFSREFVILVKQFFHSSKQTECFMRKQRYLNFALVLMMLALSQSYAQKPQQAPNIKLKAQDGKIVELAKLRGKVVAINFWATWCGPCRKEIPGMMEVYSQYKAKWFEILGVALDEDGWDVVKPYIEKSKMTYPVVVGDGNLAQAYGGIDAIPATFFVDKKGNVVKKHVGYMSKEDFENAVKGLLL